MSGVTIKDSAGIEEVRAPGHIAVAENGFLPPPVGGAKTDALEDTLVEVVAGDEIAAILGLPGVRFAA